MHISKAFPSNYLKAADLENREPVVTISEVKVETLGDDTKLVVYFVSKDKGLVLNKTNANTIAELTGSEDTDDWPGKRIKLITAKVEYQGKRVPAIRIEEAGGAPKPKAIEPADLTSEDIPFGWVIPLILSSLAGAWSWIS